MQQNFVDTNWLNNMVSEITSNSFLKQAFDYSYKEPWFFTEFSFLFVFSIFLIFYTFIIKQNNLKKFYIICFSLFFYFKSSGPFLLLFILMIIIDYFLAFLIYKKEGISKKIFLWISLLFSLSFLLYFKYSNFFIQNFNQLLGTSFNQHNLFLPIGISFYTFQSISYLVDVYRNEILPAKKISDYAFYMTFFPHLVAGPIVRAKDFLPQIINPNILNKILYKESVLRIIIGLLKKLFIADYLGKYVDIIHQSPTNFSGVENLLSMYAYCFQIYFDFSGYSDIAIGIALLLGYRLKENFNNPYFSKNITEFWRKWHISLSNWLKDYIYIPLGGNRKGKFNTYLFLLATMLIGGFWHGADWRFLIWGLAHGLALIIHKAWSKLFPNLKHNTFSNFLGIVITFHFVALCWILFRSNSFADAFTSINKIIFNIHLIDFNGFWFSRKEFCYVLIIASFIVFIPPIIKEKFFVLLNRLPTLTWIVWFMISLQIIIQFKDDIVQPFIYFQF